MSNAQGRKNKQESQETLIREGDKVRRVRPDGSDGGYIFGSGSGHSPHSDRRHGNGAVIEDLFHKADDGDQMARQELDKRGLWLDLRRSNVFAQPTDELLNQLELTRDFEPTRRMKERRKMLVAALMDRYEASGEEFVKASSTEELHTMRSRYEAYGRPPHFTKTAQLIEAELAKRESQANTSDYTQNNTADPASHEDGRGAPSYNRYSNYEDTGNHQERQAYASSAEQIVKGRSTEELLAARDHYIAQGSPPDFANAAQLINDELARRGYPNVDMRRQGDFVVDPKNDNIYGETTPVDLSNEQMESFRSALSRMPDDKLKKLKDILAKYTSEDAWKLISDEEIKRFEGKPDRTPVDGQEKIKSMFVDELIKIFRANPDKLDEHVQAMGFDPNTLNEHKKLRDVTKLISALFFPQYMDKQMLRDVPELRKLYNQAWGNIEAFPELPADKQKDQLDHIESQQQAIRKLFDQTLAKAKPRKLTNEEEDKLNNFFKNLPSANKLKEAYGLNAKEIYRLFGIGLSVDGFINEMNKRLGANR